MGRNERRGFCSHFDVVFQCHRKARLGHCQGLAGNNLDCGHVLQVGHPELEGRHEAAEGVDVGEAGHAHKALEQATEEARGFLKREQGILEALSEFTTYSNAATFISH